tara:strand:- start:835 stop:1221 length:387 start_codon:yes stop_codon:yes gene_type:complete
MTTFEEENDPFAVTINAKGDKVLPVINIELVKKFTSLHIESRRVSEIINAPEIRVLSPVKKKQRTDKQTKMIERHFSKMSYAEDNWEDPPDGEERDLNYLPEPRLRNNPNARGGSIRIEAKAPTIRLD